MNLKMSREITAFQSQPPCSLISTRPRSLKDGSSQRHQLVTNRAEKPSVPGGVGWHLLTKSCNGDVTYDCKSGLEPAPSVIALENKTTLFLSPNLFLRWVYTQKLSHRSWRNLLFSEKSIPQDVGFFVSPRSKRIVGTQISGSISYFPSLLEYSVLPSLSM